ncbi:MAG: hypothetical protein J0M08_11000 [Bacteroidetes bacterium]|nr:hypothetical protein [Bacteroidota bacterium]
MFNFVAYNSYKFFFAPRYYILNDTQLIIVRPIANKVFERKSIVNAKVIDNAAFLKIQRTFGVGGLFGYFGVFSGIYVFATQKKNGILFTTASDNKEYIISPDDTALYDNLISKTN